jgi:polar amino acid transport system ATP-binding protein
MARLAKGGMTMLVVSHEMGFAGSVANEIIFIENGRIVEAGPPEQLYKKPKEQRTREFLSKITGFND